jgi:NADH dehydrogenase FAD-containing subunit
MATSEAREEPPALKREARGGTLIVGGGFAGAYVAKLLGKRGSTIVSRENFMLYTPILPRSGLRHARSQS